MNNSVLLYAYVISNIIIVLGYVTLSVLVAPVTDFKRKYTRWGAMIFFLTCGLHHVHNIQHSLSPGIYQTVSIQLPHVLIDIAQSIAVWVFIFGLSQEVQFRRIPIKDEK
jgi:hypothetical protein